MDHSLYAYLTRRTTRELTIVLDAVPDSDDEVSMLIFDMVLKILSDRENNP